MPRDPFVDVAALRSLGAVRVPADEWDAATKAADTGFAKAGLLGWCTLGVATLREMRRPLKPGARFSSPSAPSRPNRR